MRRQLAAYQRNQRRGEDDEKEGYEFYDVTAWSLPFTLGLDAWWTDDTSPVTGERVGGPLPIAPPTPGRAQSAYVFTNESEAATRLAMRLLREGFLVGIATRPLIADGASCPRGTFVVRVQRNALRCTSGLRCSRPASPGPGDRGALGLSRFGSGTGAKASSRCTRHGPARRGRGH